MSFTGCLRMYHRMSVSLLVSWCVSNLGTGRGEGDQGQRETRNRGRPGTEGGQAQWDLREARGSGKGGRGMRGTEGDQGQRETRGSGRPGAVGGELADTLLDTTRQFSSSITLASVVICSPILHCVINRNYLNINTCTVEPSIPWTSHLPASRA